VFRPKGRGITPVLLGFVGQVKCADFVRPLA